MQRMERQLVNREDKALMPTEVPILRTQPRPISDDDMRRALNDEFEPLDLTVHGTSGRQAGPSLKHPPRENYNDD